MPKLPVIHLGLCALHDPTSETLTGGNGCAFLLQGNTYNIPVSITIPADYPIMAPECFVEPTSTMELNLAAHSYSLHPNEDGRRGRVETYCAWVPEHSSLFDIIVDLCRLFSISPPVKSKSTASQSLRPSASMPAPYGTLDRPGATATSLASQPGKAAYPVYNPAAMLDRPPISYPPPPPPVNNGATTSWYPPAPPGASSATPSYPPAYAAEASTATTGKPSQPSPPAKPDTHREEFKERAVKALSSRMMASLQQSNKALWQEVVTLEGQADALSNNRQVCCFSKTCVVDRDSNPSI
jgi:hypothetical protein